MDRDEVWQAIDEQRSSLADLLDDLSPAEWETPSLCDGWRVRDVAAHLTLAHTGVLQGLVWFARARGNFNRAILTSARQQAKLPVEQYALRIRGMVGSRRTAPTVTHLEPLVDVLAHGQDIAVPLGRTRVMPPAPSAAAATRVWERGFPFHAQRKMAGFRLAAGDHGWSVGEGERVEGPMGAILLLLTGRHSAALPQLSGPGVPALESRLRPATENA
jgi:uncharacterized protein (TIGR03083 family)